MMANIRSSIFIDKLQPQTMCLLGTFLRGSLPRLNSAAQILEIAPGLDVEPLVDIALKAADVKVGILFVERRYGYIQIHALSTSAVRQASYAIAEALDVEDVRGQAPEILASKIITNVDHEHAFLINRNKKGSMILPGDSLFVMEMTPAAYAILVVNESEKASPIRVIDYRLMGATGRVYLAGNESAVRTAADVANLVLDGGR